MNVRYYSPRKEGKRLKYYHLSKHGGTWVQHVFRQTLFFSKTQFLTTRYAFLACCDLIGTTENLREDLEQFLAIAGYEYDKEILKLPAVRVAADLPEYTQELTPKSKALIEQFEGEAIQMWEEVHAKSKT